MPPGGLMTGVATRGAMVYLAEAAGLAEYPAPAAIACTVSVALTVIGPP